MPVQHLSSRYPLWASSMIDLPALAKAAVELLAPFLPYLASTGEAASRVVMSVVLDDVGERLKRESADLWARLTGRTGEAGEVARAAKPVAAAPDDDEQREGLRQAIEAYLTADPQLAGEVLTLLGGPARVMRISAGDDAEIAQVRQIMRGGGVQEVTGGNRASIRHVDQIML